MINFEDTIIAPATTPGTGAISLLRISGPSALSLVDSLVSFAHGNAVSAAGNSVKFGWVTLADGSTLDEVLCCIYKAPHSYTGEDSVEIMCHASSYIVSTLLEMAVEHGARIAQPGEFTQRAFLAGKMDLAQAEAVADVIAASSSSAHKLAFRQLKGGISSELSILRGQLLEMTALLELELDFSEEDVEFADRAKLDALLEKTISHIDGLASSFRLGNAIKKGVPVAIVGAANAGKSTLLNSILGEQRSIVSDIAGTTRDTVEECFNSDGILFRLVDTAGIREVISSDSGAASIEKIGIERSFESIRKADVVVVLIDAERLVNEMSLNGVNSSNALSDSLSTLSPASLSSLNAVCQIIDACQLDQQKLIIALNKCDLVGESSDNIFVNAKNKIVSYIENKCLLKTAANIKTDFVKISAKTGNGIQSLLKIMTDYEKSALSNQETRSEIITNARHFSALSQARNYLSKVRDSLRLGTPSDLAAEDLRAALSCLASITGEISTDEVLGEIFGKFCIGK